MLEENRFDDLIHTHSSTAERISFYPELKKRISALDPKSILDLGCGLNPLVLATPSITYYASDIREDELKIIDEFFKKNNIPGKTFVYDLRKMSDPLPQADLCLMFKVMDIVTRHNHRFAQTILTTVPCKNLLVSFSTRKLSGKRMNQPRRLWFEKTVEKLGYSMEQFESDNEVFYLIRKQ